MAKVTAHGELNAHDIEAEVLNPGGWFGKPWLVEIGCGYSSIFYVVEAGSYQDAIDEFVDSDTGKRHVGIPPEDYGDYGYHVHPGDIVGGRTFTEKGIVNLKGEFFPEGDERGKYLSEPYTGDGGTLADLEHMMVHGKERADVPWECEYAVDGLEDLIKPAEYGQPTYKVTRDEHDGEHEFKTENAANNYIAERVGAGEGEEWEYNVIEIPCTYA